MGELLEHATQLVESHLRAGARSAYLDAGRILLLEIAELRAKLEESKAENDRLVGAHWQHLERLMSEQAEDRAAIRALYKATEQLAHCSHACDVPCPHTRAYSRFMSFDLNVAAIIARAESHEA